MDFYSPDDLSAAKIQLLKDSQKVNSLNFPHVPQQRQGENRVTREVDDMFTLLTALSASEMTYICVGWGVILYSLTPDNMPSIRLYEGDFGVLMSLLDHFKSKLGVMESAISSVARDVYSMHTKVMSLEAGPQPQLQRPLRPARSTQCDVNNVDNQSVVMGQTDGFSVLSVAPVMTGISSQTADSRLDRNSQLDIDMRSTHSNNWASLVSTPFQRVGDNRRWSQRRRVVHRAAFSASQATATTVSSTETAETNWSRYTSTESDPASSSPDHDRQVDHIERQCRSRQADTQEGGVLCGQCGYVIYRWWH